jgi:hypothetical protein
LWIEIPLSRSSVKTTQSACHIILGMDATSVIVIVCGLVVARYVLLSCWARWPVPGVVLSVGNFQPRRAAMRLLWRGSLLNRMLDLHRTRSPGPGQLGQLEHRVAVLETEAFLEANHKRGSEWNKFVAEQGWAPSLGSALIDDDDDEHVVVEHI